MSDELRIRAETHLECLVGGCDNDQGSKWGRDVENYIRSLESEVAALKAEKLFDGWVDDLIVAMVNDYGATGVTIWTQREDEHEQIPVSIVRRKV